MGGIGAPAVASDSTGSPRETHSAGSCAGPGTLAERRRIRVAGLVQGVGFRPHVHRLAVAFGLAGWVRNDAAGVLIEVEGSAALLDAFVAALTAQAPQRARVDRVAVQTLAQSSLPHAVPARSEDAFVIAPSAGGATTKTFPSPSETGSVAATEIGPDTTVCEACLAELFDPNDRRWRYPFINCTQCGPRFTLTRDLPYDRGHTSMARFELCAHCAREYRDPGDRRFHAEPNACPVCGPRLRLVPSPSDSSDAGTSDAGTSDAGTSGADTSGADTSGADTSGADTSGAGAVDPISAALARLRAGQVVAIKGLGGYHLACDARNGAAVRALRARKQRDAKPFAVMALNRASLDTVAEIDAQALAMLSRAERPIVLLPKRAGCDAEFEGVAPGLAWLGAMLPYTPLHYLLFHEAAGRPGGVGWLQQPCALVLVMTSANPHGEPLVRDDDEALERLDGIVDAWLAHDREIVVRCDDSVLAAGSDGAPRLLRRGRGYTPVPIALARDTPPVLAFGGWYQNAVCATRGAQAFLSQHVGDLDGAASRAFLDETVEHLRRVLRIAPAAIAHDLHPDFHSTRAAQASAAELGIPALAVQHHHAHVAAVLAEHRAQAPVLGLALDGVGLGCDGAAWGGEMLVVDGARMERVGRLCPLSLPGGDAAAREPWRMAASALHALGRADEIGRRFAVQRAAGATDPIAAMLARGLRTPPTSSLGRYFDAAAALLGVRLLSSYEGEAAMCLQSLAQGRAAPKELEPLWELHARPGAGARAEGLLELDLLALLARLADEPDPIAGAVLFHAALADALAEWVFVAARRLRLTRVAAAGGCLQNVLLASRLRKRLAAAGLELLEARLAPPGDGGLALGQAWVAQRALFEAS